MYQVIFREKVWCPTNHFELQRRCSPLPKMKIAMSWFSFGSAWKATQVLCWRGAYISKFKFCIKRFLLHGAGSKFCSNPDNFTIHWNLVRVQCNNTATKRIIKKAGRRWFNGKYTELDVHTRAINLHRLTSCGVITANSALLALNASTLSWVFASFCVVFE